MLEENNVPFEYREYREAVLSEAEIRDVLAALGRSASEVVRRRDRAFKELNLQGDETDEVLVPLMAQHPTLLERPIGVVRSAAGVRAAVGRPPENLLELAG